MVVDKVVTQLLAQRDVNRVISRRQVTRAFRFAGSALDQRLAEPDVATVRQRMLHEYALLAPTVPRLRAPMSRMTLRIAVDALALYRALPADLPQDDKLAVVSAFVRCWMRGQFDRPFVRWVYAHRPTHLMLRRAWFASANRLDEPEGWRFRYHPSCPGLFYGVDVTRCGIVRFLAQHGAPELAPLMCRGDYAITDYLPTRVTVARTQVIADGAPHCDFRYRLDA